MKKYKIQLILAVFCTINFCSALRASQLILQAKTSSTTSTTEVSLRDDIEVDGLEMSEELLNNTSTKPTLTGIPQIDYIWDPNLPRELRGYNLTEYPFFNAVPPDEEIDFKCDGLHDGFYASVKHKCQLYHHCLFGVRYDFLCANFTAFDQKTFICHFVSEVDCKNSPKYFHRNDALYMPATTTTLAPSTTTTTTTTTTPAPQRRQNKPNRRPLRRKRPQYEDDEYYDDYDYYEDRPYRRHNQRPRHRRPDYDDDEEFDERRSFSDERYDRKSHRNRYDEYEDEPISFEGRRKYDPRNRNRYSHSKVSDNEKNDRRGNRYIGNSPRPSYESSDEVPSKRDRKRFENRRQSERRNNQRDRRPANKEESTDNNFEDITEKSEEKILVKPSVSSSSSLSSLFDRPRAAPRISRPVPNNEKSKYAYNVTSTSTTSTQKSIIDDEYYDEEDYDHEPEHKNVTRDIIQKTNLNKEEKKEIEDEEEEEPIGQEDKETNNEPYNSRTLNSESNHRDNHNQRDNNPNLRIVKRPFLPSRGGSPYLPRGLQPVGSIQNDFSTESTPIDMGSTISGVRLLEHGQPILRTHFKDALFTGPRTTLTPKTMAKVNIEDLYETEYDVTLNDALNPTLKPLSSDLRRKATFPHTREDLSQTMIQESRHSHNSNDY